MNSNWRWQDGLYSYRPVTHTQNCHDACPGRIYLGVVQVDTEAWSSCFCSCHHPMEGNHV